MKEAYFCFTIDDVGYEGYSTEDHLERLLDFCNEQGLKGTFFVVPLGQGKKLGEQSGYVELLKQAISQGHEIAQHGLEHDRFECGIPPEMILSLPHEGPARERLRKHREEIEKSLQIEPLRKKLSLGRSVLEEGVGQKVNGFRAPCLSTCENLFHALCSERYLYDSSKYLQETGWDLLNGKNSDPRPITRQMFDSMQYPGALRIFPLTTEYTWYLGKKNFQVTLDLAKYDVRACIRAGIPFVPICHVSPIQKSEEDCGFELYRHLLDYAHEICSKSEFDFKSLTLSEMCERCL